MLDGKEVAISVNNMVASQISTLEFNIRQVRKYLPAHMQTVAEDLTAAQHRLMQVQMRLTTALVADAAQTNVQDGTIEIPTCPALPA